MFWKLIDCWSHHMQIFSQMMQLAGLLMRFFLVLGPVFRAVIQGYLQSESLSCPIRYLIKVGDDGRPFKNSLADLFLDVFSNVK